LEDRGKINSIVTTVNFSPNYFQYRLWSRQEVH
jgi:hypothetical protein